MTRDEEVLKSMVDHPAGRHARVDDDELDMTFIDMANEAYEDNRGRFRWSWGLVGHALTGVAVIAIFYINLVYLSGVGL
ncbi:hypothetical protein [Corynebacterium parakroppenstedtii]|uniref:hypothetical protein n=1 Tax=Corynebacterium parakroppenstedtii TaxID=2828363 RepID=UPI001C8D48B7|nr:hypothetical protein [Corynebacterium parakroppenstedtii]MBY0797847.1 hypothetical protein [Corynebacterium parakroppenstedtii]